MILRQSLPSSRASLSFSLPCFATSFNIGSNRSRYDRRWGEMDWAYRTPTNYGYPSHEGYGSGIHPDDRYHGSWGGIRGGGGGWDPRLDYDYAPPPVGWVPQRDWGGYEFASAQGRGMGRGLYDDVAGRLGGYYEDYQADELLARQAHRLVYGQRDPYRAHAQELGAAAAYEAFLLWDRAAHSGRGWSRGGRGLEGLSGLAMGEAWNLVIEVGADRDPRREERILRTATATARALYDSQWDRFNDDYGGRLIEAPYGSVGQRYLEYSPPPRSRRIGRGSFSSDAQFAGGPSLSRRRSFDDDYLGGRAPLAIGGPSMGHSSGTYFDDRGRYGPGY